MVTSIGINGYSIAGYMDGRLWFVKGVIRELSREVRYE